MLFFEASVFRRLKFTQNKKSELPASAPKKVHTYRRVGAPLAPPDGRL